MPGTEQRYCDAAPSRTAGESPGETQRDAEPVIPSFRFFFNFIFTECLDCVRHCPKHHEHKQEEVTFCLKGEFERSRQVNRV